MSLDCRSAEFSGAIRNARRQPGAMSNDDLSKVLSGLKAQPYGGRSALYRWLRANHRRLSRRLAKDQTSWAVTASEIAAVGITNTKGGPPSSDSVRRVWATVAVTWKRTAPPRSPIRKGSLPLGYHRIGARRLSRRRRSGRRQRRQGHLPAGVERSAGAISGS